MGNGKFIRYTPYPATVGSVRNKVKKTKRKEQRREKSKEKMNWGRSRNLPPQPWQLMPNRGRTERIKKRIKIKDKKGKGAAVCMTEVFGSLKIKWMMRKWGKGYFSLFGNLSRWNCRIWKGNEKPVWESLWKVWWEKTTVCRGEKSDLWGKCGLDNDLWDRKPGWEGKN